MLFMFFTSRFLGFACGNQHTDQQDQQHGQRHNGRNNNGFNFNNTAAEKADNRGWVNIGRWDDVPFTKDGKKTTFTLPELMISFTGVGIEGGCPAEKDNVGCYYLKDGTFTLVPAEKITANKEFCDCEFAWRFAGGTHGVSLGKALPAIPEEETTHYEKAAFTVENAAVIPCMQVLGAYQVTFER